MPNRSAGARKHFEEAVRIQPGYADAHVNLGLALAEIPGRLPEAIRHLQEAQRIKPDPEVGRILEKMKAAK
jgi:tetratricopeptide (TPR) repeat protein